MLAIASWPPVGLDERLRRPGSSQSVIGVQHVGELDPAAERCEHGEHADRDQPIDQLDEPSCAACGGCSRTYADGSPPKTRKSIRNV